MNNPIEMGGERPPAIELVNIAKTYGSTRAARAVCFDVRPGEIVALVGENGAGKSTLMNILSGVVTPDEGEIYFQGCPVRFATPQAAQAHGIATVFQELSLSPILSVMENIFAGRAPRKFGFVDWTRMRAAARDLLKQLDLEIDPDISVGDLAMSSRQMVEIAKAISLGARVMLFDEPTSALNADEKQAFFRVVGRLKAAGTAIIYISHHLDEVIELSDRIVVLRDGTVVTVTETAQATPEGLVHAMVGRELETAQALQPPGEIVMLSVDHINGHGVREASLVVQAGEIVSIAGLMGAGRSQLVQMIVGLLRQDSGVITVAGGNTSGGGMSAALKRGIAYVPAERKSEGLFLDLPVATNIAVTTLPKSSRSGMVVDSRIQRLARKHIDQLSIRPSSPQVAVRSLSGGNQQKVLLAKWFEIGPRLFVVEEPTKGVDIGAKYDIHREIRALAASGTAVLVVSSDLPEILSLSHRVLVMHQGRLVADLDARHTTEQEIVAHASGLEERNHAVG